jgi:hypothetical protein
MDLLLEWQSPKGMYGMDHKTTSTLGRMSVKPNNQITGYVFPLYLTYTNVMGYFLNEVGVYMEDEEIDKNAPKVPSQKTGKLIYAKKPRELFLRTPTSRTAQELETWKDEVIHTIHEIEECERTRRWSKHAPQFCNAYHSTCAYTELCQAQDPERVKDALIRVGVYEVSPWVAYQEKEEVDENTI